MKSGEMETLSTTLHCSVTIHFLKYSESRSYLSSIYTVCPLPSCTVIYSPILLVLISLCIAQHPSPAPKITFPSTHSLFIPQPKQPQFCPDQFWPYLFSSILAFYNTLTMCFFVRYIQLLNLITYILTPTSIYYCGFMDSTLHFQCFHGLPLVHPRTGSKSSKSCRDLSALGLEGQSTLVLYCSFRQVFSDFPRINF